MSLQRNVLCAAVAVASIAFAGAATAATISSVGGAFTVGIGANGELYDLGTGVGFARNADGYDPITPGTPRDSWGVGVVGGGAAYADGQFFGSSVAGTALTAGANTAQAITDTGLGLTVTQTYSFVGGGNILKIDTAVTNTTGASLDAIFQRNVDWDIDPTQTNESVSGPYGAFPSVIDSSYYGFESPNPNDGPFASSCFSGCYSTGDLGAGIRISLGSLAGGATSHFAYYYGLNLAGQDWNQLIAQGHAAGAAYIIAGQSSENGDYPNLGANSAILGVGGVGGVPEPAAWAMMILGFFGLGAVARQRRAVAA